MYCVYITLAKLVLNINQSYTFRSFLFIDYVISRSVMEKYTSSDNVLSPESEINLNILGIWKLIDKDDKKKRS